MSGLSPEEAAELAESYAKMDEGATREIRVTVRLLPSENARFEAAAKRDSRKLTDMIRVLALAELSRRENNNVAK